MRYDLSKAMDSTNLIDVLSAAASKALSAPQAKALRGKSIAPSGADSFVAVADAAAEREKTRAKREHQKKSAKGGVRNKQERNTRLEGFKKWYWRLQGPNVSHSAAVARAADEVKVGPRTGKRYAKLLGLSAKK